MEKYDGWKNSSPGLMMSAANPLKAIHYYYTKKSVAKGKATTNLRVVYTIIFLYIKLQFSGVRTY